MPDGKAVPESIERLIQRILKDKLTRVRLMSRMLDVLSEFGVRHEDISLLPDIEVVPKAFQEGAGAGTAQIIFTSRRNAKREETSILIC